jgi:glycosyltransferase involved in cell wall biosynthesis
MDSVGMERTKLSAVVVALNEERNIARCVAAALAAADEVLVADTGSTDATAESARAAGARVVSLPWQGFARTKNAAHQLAAHRWILSLDADEVVDAELAQSIREFMRNPNGKTGKVSRLPYYCGKAVRHCGWFPDKKVRLFAKDRARWVGDFVHETLQCPDPPVELKGFLHHYTVGSVAEHVRTVNRYSDLQAQEYLSKGKRITFFHLFFKPAYVFFNVLIFRRGILDGMAGWMIATISAFSYFLKYAKVRMRQP